MFVRTKPNGFFFKSLTFSLFIISISGFSQTFDIEQIEQIWRPRLKFDTKYLAPAPFSDTTGKYSSYENTVGFTFPIVSKLGADLKLDLSSLKLKDILKNSVRIKASQLLGTAKFGYKQAHLGFDSISNKNLLYAQAGIMGLYLTRKYRILFYSANCFISEDQKKINSTVPRVNGTIGQYHLRGLRKNYYYGIYLSYSDGLFIPVPFFGGKTPINDKWSFNYLLPAQMYLLYSPTSNASISGGITLDGYRSGVQLNTKRVNMNYGNVAAFINYRQKLNKLFYLRFEGGYCIRQYIKVNDATNNHSAFPIGQGFYGQITITTLFGKSLFEKVVDGIKDNFTKN